MDSDDPEEESVTGLEKVKKIKHAYTGERKFPKEKETVEHLTQLFKDKNIEAIYRVFRLDPIGKFYWRARIEFLLEWGRFAANPNIYQDRAEMLLSNMKRDGQFLAGKWVKRADNLNTQWSG